MRKCAKCGKKMNPVEVMLSSGNKPLLCGECIRKLHKEVTK